MTIITNAETKAFLAALLADKDGARAEIESGRVDIRQLSIPDVQAHGSTRYSQIKADAQLREGKLVDLSEYGFGATPDYYDNEARFNPVYGHRFQGATPSVILLDTLAERLAEANDSLRRNYGLEFDPMNGFRPLVVQKAIFNDFYSAGLRKFQGELSGAELEERAMQHALTYASRPPERVTLTDSTTWYAHGTGAAIDLLLRLAGGGARLDFGVIFDDPDSKTHARSMEGVTSESSASGRAFQANRRTLFWSLASAGFVNYPEEFFHFDPFQVAGHTTQFAILNAGMWGISGAAGLRATIPAAREALTE
jgi:D-alanyl-D-alanine dipeptidase